MADKENELKGVEKLNLDELDAVTGGVNGNAGSGGLMSGNTNKSNKEQSFGSIGNGYMRPTDD